MHELSIANSILELAQRHVPPGEQLRSIKVRVGPMRGIDPLCMQYAWQACVAEAGVPTVQLDIEYLAWQLRCPDCLRRFSSESVDARCSCGSDRPCPEGGDELTLDSIQVDPLAVPTGGPACESLSLKTS